MGGLFFFILWCGGKNKYIHKKFKIDFLNILDFEKRHFVYKGGGGGVGGCDVNISAVNV